MYGHAHLVNRNALIDALKTKIIGVTGIDNVESKFFQTNNIDWNMTSKTKLEYVLKITHILLHISMSCYQTNKFARTPKRFQYELIRFQFQSTSDENTYL